MISPQHERLIVEILFDRSEIDRVIAALPNLPEQIRPVFFGDHETKVNKNSKISNTEAFSKFREKNGLGFFLFSKETSWNISISEKTPSSITLYAKGSTPDVIYCFFEIMSAINPIFGFACDIEEYYHRNRYKMKFEKFDSEGWVGRKLEKFVPGLYWFTFLSKELIDKFGVDISSILKNALFKREFGSGEFILVQFFDNSDEWMEHRNFLDDLCRRTEGIFSIQSVHEVISRSQFKTWQDFNDAIWEFR